MDERVLGEMPAEGSDGGRRFGIYRAYSPGPKMHSISRVKVVFVAAIAAVVAFAVFFPMIQYASRSKKSINLPYPEIVNSTFELGERPSTTNTPDCSTNVFSFGHDCAGSTSTKDDLNSSEIHTDVSTVDDRKLGVSTTLQYEDDVSDIPKDLREIRDRTFQRRGRSKWPIVSTPYPYYVVPKPTPEIDRNSEDQFVQESNIFAIPFDFTNDNFSDYSTSRVNFTPPPYAFTPFPNFTDSYAQLSPYKVPKNHTNFEAVMKYLKNSRASDESLPVVDKPDTIKSRVSTMKVSGTYVMPLDRRRPGEIDLSSSENSEEMGPFFNGHAYVSDPFVKFRPANPLEINRLIPVKSSLDIGPRFRKPISFVPAPSFEVDMSPPIPPNTPTDKEDLEASGSHTVAIFHPPPSVSQRPPTLQRPTTLSPKKPLSVTLDIYPVTVEMNPETSSHPSTPPGRDRGRLNPKWRPKATERPRWRPQAPRRPSTAPTKPTPNNHMIVHLNLFPSKRKPYTYPRRSRGDSTTAGVPTVALLSDAQVEPREDQDNVTSATSNTENKSGFGLNLPEPFALRSSSKSDENSTKLKLTANENPHPESENLTTYSYNDTRRDENEAKENVKENMTNVVGKNQSGEMEDTMISTFKSKEFEDPLTTDVTKTDPAETATVLTIS